jgi:hypothetical protein
MHTKTLLTIALILSFAAAALAAEAAKPFNGKSLDGWKLKGPAEKSNWKVGAAKLAENPREIAFSDGGEQLVNAKGGGVDIYTEQKFGDCTIELEVMVPKGSYSGIYVMGEYEVQVFDSYGKQNLGGGDMGAIYSAAPPRVNATKAPGEWNKYVIQFQAPRFDADGKKIANAKFIKVVLNDKVLHENVTMNGPTPGGVSGQEHATGPIMFQGDHGPVAYRDIKVTATKTE